jgi:hypothetical protein
MPLRPEAQAGPSAAPSLWCAICQVGGKHTHGQLSSIAEVYTDPPAAILQFL